jgi:hypothetical protein
MYSSNAFYRSEAADCFSFAGVSAAKEKFLFLCVLGVSSEVPQGRDKRAVNNMFLVAAFAALCSLR